MQKISPKIQKFSWGCIEVEGQPRDFKDAKLYPDGAEEWDWRKFGTQHVPGIHPDEVDDLTDKGSEVIVLSQGFYGRLLVPDKTISKLKKKNIEVFIRNTEEAIKVYNQLRETKKVGALIHSTC
ncbi:MAG: Mth938-like domain-containing protein [Bacteroidales bacterium]|nr:Mth938-like domain-containing protein [Bacteroidales bacterium]